MREAHVGEQGFAVLQILIVLAIAATVAGIGLPAYASRAKEAVLEQNVVILSEQVKGILAADQGLGLDGRGVAAELTRELGGGDAGRYANPLSGSDAIVWQTCLSGDAESDAPAIWITDNVHYAHNSFSVSTATKSRLAGTLIVVLPDAQDLTNSIGVFYVDAQGRCSETAVNIAPPCR